MSVSDCEFEMSEYEYEMTVYGMTWMSLTRATVVWHEWVWGSMTRVSVPMNDIK